MIDTTSLGNQILPSVASDGTNYLVVWQDYRSGESDIYAARVDTFGTVLDQPPIPICTTGGDQMSAYAAFIGSNYIVAWEDHRDADNWDIYCARVDTSGVLLDTSAILITQDTSHQSAPHIACNSEYCLVVWRTDPAPDTALVCGTRVSESGTVLDSPTIEIDREIEDMWGNLARQYAVRVAAGYTNYLVSWQMFSRYTGWHLWVALVDTSGDQVYDAGMVGSGGDDQSATSAFSGDRYLITYQSYGGSWDICGVRMAASGGLLDPPSRFQLEGQQYSAFSAFDGGNYFVVWCNLRDSGNGDIYGGRIDTSGLVLDSAGIELINKEYVRGNPAICSGWNDHMLLVYGGYAPAPYDTNRVFGAVCHGVGMAEASNSIPPTQHHQLHQNTPNPFGSVTTIGYSVPIACHITLEVYDIAGRLVETLADQVKGPGTYRAEWRADARSAGIYFCRLTAGDLEFTRKMVVVD